MISNIVVQILDLVSELNLVLYPFLELIFGLFAFSSILPEISTQGERGP